MAGLDAWIDGEEAVARRNMLAAISATHLVHRRPAFGQVVRPAKGSVLASPVSAYYDPDPDYFFHWQRDTAVILGALVALIDDGIFGKDGHETIADIVRFTLSLDALDGRAMAADPSFGEAAAPEVRQYLRSREELSEVHGDRVRMEPRFNPDGTLDILGWGRPQIDGVAARALVLRDYGNRHGFSQDLRRLVDADIDFTLRHASMESVDIWEERLCADYYTRSVQAALLGSAARDAGDPARAEVFGEAANRLGTLLDAHWSPERACYRAAAGTGIPGDRDIDFAVVFAALHSGRTTGPHSIADPRIQASFATLADIFAEDYAINRGRPAPAMGRFRGDVYQSGGAYFFSTLAAAELFYRLSALAAEGGLTATSENARFFAQTGIEAVMGHRQVSDALIARGDGFLDTVKAFTPADGALSEQFDQDDGRQTSAKHLTWSYAAFLTAASARREATRSIGPACKG
ncbi:glycoside hydrolase family 15 protein [Rhodobium gokarnense]|uniref:glucan 1,4-alpha-glucosidase n=1 Tax=Rhodobium gokarnense TaxID=364296 RepID=A0ABT3HF61_9HYPH|nr:glycoside hydrolase family 15 protein [Rhodobium gokarnense]MCW2309048.1 glucoamylase [Rhodobium gokarnense]